MQNIETELETIYNSLEAAQLLRIGADTIRQLARTGRISHRRIGRGYFFTPADLNEYRSGAVVKAKR